LYEPSHTACLWDTSKFTVIFSAVANKLIDSLRLSLRFGANVGHVSGWRTHDGCIADVSEILAISVIALNEYEKHSPLI
jgi:hypothetical protein